MAVKDVRGKLYQGEGTMRRRKGKMEWKKNHDSELYPICTFYFTEKNIPTIDECRCACVNLFANKTNQNGKNCFCQFVLDV